MLKILFIDENYLNLKIRSHLFKKELKYKFY